MRLLPALVIMFTTSVARSAPCEVEVLHAPESVGNEIRTWMLSEPDCRRVLRVRVFETPDGFYVTAREPSGRLYERVVPDGRTAAVLVASWAANDCPAPDVTPSDAESTPAMPASAVTIASAPPPTVTVARSSARSPYLVDFGGMYSLMYAGASVRVGIDALRLGPVMLGIAGARETTSFQLEDNGGADLRTTALQLFARAAIERMWGKSALRLELAGGLEQISDDNMSTSKITAGMVAGSLTAGYWFTDNWRFRGGPLVATVPDMTFPTITLIGGLDARLWVGIDRRL